VVECSPATRAARVRFPASAFKNFFFDLLDFILKMKIERGSFKKKPTVILKAIA
jgi:hypothetical protein